MINIDWEKHYNDEFACPHCNQIGMKVKDRDENNKRRFKCQQCNKQTSESYNLKLLHKWIKGFVCPNTKCNSSYVVSKGTQKGKKMFQCKVCRVVIPELNNLNKTTLSRYAYLSSSIKVFNFEDDEWDLRAINTSIDNWSNRYTVNFIEIKLFWFEALSKQCIYHLCKLNKSVSTIDKYMTTFRLFSAYLTEHNIFSINKINRDSILNFLVCNQSGKHGIKHRLQTLRGFFTMGNVQQWFQVDPDIIRDEDYPKSIKGNPDPISDNVREQIENNLHKLPDPIARMWIIAFFTAMRPYELASLQKDCLAQEGEDWKIIWWRRKGKSQHQHSVPITRSVAKIIQEQQKYVEQLWGKDWKYLFCHYQNISPSNPSHPRLKPVKKSIPRCHSPLQGAIRCLINSESICDDNGQLAKFSPCLVRATRLTELFLQGHDLAVISAWAGHKHSTTTSNFYIQVSCEQIEKEAGHIQRALLNYEGKLLKYESLPKSFWENPYAHELNLAGTHINTPIYGYCGLPLDEGCEKFRACYTCSCFVSKPEKLPLYIEQRNELRDKESVAMAKGHDVLIEHYKRQADQLDKIITGLQGKV